MADGKPSIGEKRAEIFTHESSDPVYGMNWSVRSNRSKQLLVLPTAHTHTHEYAFQRQTPDTESCSCMSAHKVFLNDVTLLAAEPER